MRTIFDIIDRHTQDFNETTTEPRHRLYGLLIQGEGVAVQVPRDLGADLADLTAQAAI